MYSALPAICCKEGYLHGLHSFCITPKLVEAVQMLNQEITLKSENLK